MLTFSPPPTTCSREVTSDRVNPSRWATCRNWLMPTSSTRDSTTFITSERDTAKEGAERRGRRGLTRNELGVHSGTDLWYTNKNWTCECDGGSQLVTVMWPQYPSHMTSADSPLSHWLWFRKRNLYNRWESVKWLVKSWNSDHTVWRQQSKKHLQQTTVERSTTAQPVTHLGVAVHHELLQVAESHLSTARLTGGEEWGQCCTEIVSEIDNSQQNSNSRYTANISVPHKKLTVIRMYGR